MIDKVLRLAGIQSQEDRDSKLYNDLVRHEAQIGGKLFGALPKGHRREFFCLDETTWIWHEEWKNKSGKRVSRTIRYIVRPDSVIKSSNGGKYKYLTKAEATHFFDAIRAYEKNVKRELYQMA